MHNKSQPKLQFTGSLLDEISGFPSVCFLYCLQNLHNDQFLNFSVPTSVTPVRPHRYAMMSKCQGLLVVGKLGTSRLENPAPLRPGLAREQELFT